MNDIKKSLIKIAYTNPNLRKDIIEITQKSENKEQFIKGIIKLAYHNPEIREDALVFLKEAGSGKQEKRLNKSFSEGNAMGGKYNKNKSEQKPKSDIPVSIYNSAKNNTYSNINLKDYVDKELNGKTLPNPALKKNPNAKKEVAISTIFNHITKKDEFAEDAKQIIQPYLEAIVKQYESDTGEKGESKGKEQQVEQGQPQQPTVEGSPKSVVEQTNQKLEEELDTKADKIVDLPEEQQEQEIEEVAYGTLESTVSNVFDSLGVPNAKEVGESVIQGRKEDREEDKRIEKEKQEIENQIKEDRNHGIKETIDEVEHIDFETMMPDLFNNIDKDIKWNDDEDYLKDDAYPQKFLDLSDVILSDPTKENIIDGINHLPEPIQRELVEDLKENGVDKKTLGFLSITFKVLSESVGETFSHMKGIFHSIKDGFSFPELMFDDDKIAKADAYLRERGLQYNDSYLLGEKREETIKALKEFQSLDKTKNMFQKDLPKGTSTPMLPSVVKEIASLRGNIKDDDFKKLVSLTLGGDGKNITEEIQNGYTGNAEDFKKEFEKHKDLMDKAKKLGVDFEGLSKDESKKEALNKANDFLKDKNINNSLKKEIAKNFMEGKISDKDTELLDRVLKRELSPEDKLIVDKQDTMLDSFKKLKQNRDKKEQIKEFAKTQNYKDETLFNAPSISYDAIVEMSKSKDPDDSEWAKKKLKQIEKDYDKDIEDKARTTQKERENIEALFKPESEGGKPLKIKDEHGNKYTIEEIYDMADDPSDPKKQSWASKQLSDIKKSMSGELDASESEMKEEKHKELKKDKEDLIKSHEDNKRNLIVKHTQKLQEVQKDYDDKRKNIEDSTNNDIKIKTNEINEGLRDKRMESDSEIHEILKNNGFDYEDKKQKINEDYESEIAGAIGDGEKQKEITDKREKALSALDKEKKDKIKAIPEAKTIEDGYVAHEKAKKGVLQRAINKKNKAKEDALKQLKDEHESTVKNEEDKHKVDINTEEHKHKKKVNEISKGLGEKVEDDEDYSDDEKKILSNIPNKKRTELQNNMQKHFENLDFEDLDDDELEDETESFVKKNKKLFKGMDSPEAVLAAKILLRNYKEPSKEKSSPKKTKGKGTSNSTSKAETSHEDESMTQYFSGKKFPVTQKLSNGKEVKHELEFKSLLASYRKAKSKDNMFSKEYSDQVIKLYEDAKKEYETSKKNKRASMNLTSKDDKKEKIKQKIREMSKFEEKDFEELKPYFDDNLKFDKERYLEDKKKQRKEKSKELEEHRNNYELKKTKAEVQKLKKQMLMMSFGKKAYIKNQLVKIALSSREEIKNLILPLI